MHREAKTHVKDGTFDDWLKARQKAKQCSSKQNLAAAHKSSSHRGVSWYTGGTGKWRANITYNDKLYSLGYFPADMEEHAAEAYAF